MYTIGIDAGNTRIKLGLFRDAQIIDVIITETAGFSRLNLPSKWKCLQPESIGLASVVPSVNSAITGDLERYYGIRARLIKPSGCGIRLTIKNPGRVGIDRILNCRAALELFGSPVVVVDAGSAVTVDAATEKDGFCGGAIIPGAELWAKALMSTSLIGKSREARSGFPGKNTDEAISCGIRYGVPGAVNAILSASLKKYSSAKIVLTGGGGGILRYEIILPCVFRRYLTLEGIALVLTGQRHGY